MLVFEKELDDAIDVSAKAGDEVGARLDENKSVFSALDASILPALAQIVSTSELGLAMGTARARSPFCAFTVRTNKLKL